MVTKTKIKRENTRSAVKPQVQPRRPQVQPSVKTQTQPAVKLRTQFVNPQTQPVVKPQAKPVGSQAPSANKPQVQPVQPQERRVIKSGRTATQENGLKGGINQSAKSSVRSNGSDRTVQNNGRGNQLPSPAAQRGAGSAQGGRDFRR